MANKILHLTLKRKWFDLIATGEKTEEYREIKPYWTTRLKGRDYDVVRFRNGYNSDSPYMLVEVKHIVKAYGNAEWGGGDDKLYVIKLGKVLEVWDRGR